MEIKINKQTSNRTEDSGQQSQREGGTVNRYLEAKLPGLHNDWQGVKRKQVMSKSFPVFTAEWRQGLFPEVDIRKDQI